MWLAESAHPVARSSRALRGEDATLFVDEDGTVSHASHDARTVLGVRSSDLVGESVWRLAVWADRARVMAWLGASPHPPELTFHVQRRRGMVGAVLAVATRVSTGDGRSTVVRLVEAEPGDAEMDDRMLLRRTQTEVAELVRSNDELFDFALTLAHDIRSPLMTVSSAAQGLASVAGTDLSEPAQQLLAQVTHGLAKIGETIDASLRCSRAGQDLHLEEIDCHELVVSVLRRVIPTLDVGINVELGELGVVVADRVQLGLVFENVIENAVKYRVDDRPLHVSITSEVGPAQRTFCVADNGRGIAPEDRERVFRMFERLDRGTPGSGIGLAVCHRIVTAHGGTIWVSGNELGGTSFHFNVPRQALTT